MTTVNPFTRSDTLFGTCQAIGEDFGISPVLLRVGFGVALFWNIEIAVAAYLALGVVVLLSRLAFRSPRALPTPVAVPQGENDDGVPELAKAA